MLFTISLAGEVLLCQHLLKPLSRYSHCREALSFCYLPLQCVKRFSALPKLQQKYHRSFYGVKRAKAVHTFDINSETVIR